MDVSIKETENLGAAKKVVGTQISQEIYEKLKDEAERDFISVSDVLRKIIYTYFREKEMKGNKN